MYAPTAGRVLAGLAFALIGVMKAFNFAGVTAMLSDIGFPVAVVFAVALIIVEIGAGALLVVNVATRYAAYVLALVLVIAVLTVHLNMENIMMSAMPILQHLLMIGGLLAIAGSAPEMSAPASRPASAENMPADM